MLLDRKQPKNQLDFWNNTIVKCEKCGKKDKPLDIKNGEFIGFSVKTCSCGGIMQMTNNYFED